MQVTVTDTFSLLAAFFHPRITSISDVPDDQGGRVYIDFRRSFFDRPNQPNDLYTIFRRDMIDNTPEWVVVGSGAAIGENSYIYEVPTLRDSTADDDGMTQFKVVASMNEGDFHSPAQSGYSIDNIAPGVPTGLQLLADNTNITVTWDPSGDDDFQYFLLERGIDADFSTNVYVAFELVDTIYTDEEIELGQEYFYRLAAFDHAGNKSEYTQAISATALGIDPSSLIPDVFAMHQNYPNPFNPVTQIRYDLPEDSYVSITIYDIMGRNIKSLVNTDQTAGYRSIRWNATNDLGEPVSAGMYIYMIQAGEFRQTKKMVLLK
ncbi:MAG: T9SS type A sorting domain-containing protein, partial [Candidatus Neomarinimicrobiota bacterium]|nr:T9SS type A sorting domain-containing protein [Candidatus Neomarinimicrobiota bacterium]